MAKRRRKQNDGFTLIEFIIAMLMLAIIMPALTMAFRTTLDAGDRIDRRAESTAEARALLATLTHDLENAYITSADKGWFIGNDSTSGSYPSDSLSFTTLSGKPPLSDLAKGTTPADTPTPFSVYQQVNYSLQPQGNGNALLRDFASPPGEDSTATTDEDVLSDQVAGLNFEYYDGTQWMDSWDSTQIDQTQTADATTTTGQTTEPQPLMPQAIRVTLILQTNRSVQTFTTTVSLTMYNSTAYNIEADDTPQATTTTTTTGTTTGGTTGGGTTGGTTTGAPAGGTTTGAPGGRSLLRR